MRSLVIIMLLMLSIVLAGDIIVINNVQASTDAYYVVDE